MMTSKIRIVGSRSAGAIQNAQTFANRSSMGAILGPAAGLSAIVGPNSARTLDPEIGELLLDADSEDLREFDRLGLGGDDRAELGLEVEGLETGGS